MNPDKIARMILEDIKPGSLGVRIIIEGNEAVTKALVDYFHEGDEIQIDVDANVSGRYYPATHDSPEEGPEVEVNDFDLEPIKEINLSYLADYFNTDAKTAYDILQQNLPVVVPFVVGYSVGDAEIDIRITGKFIIKSIQPPVQKTNSRGELEFISQINTVIDKKDWSWEYAS